jgi:hypothetical protein
VSNTEPPINSLCSFLFIASTIILLLFLYFRFIHKSQHGIRVIISWPKQSSHASTRYPCPLLVRSTRLSSLVLPLTCHIRSQPAVTLVRASHQITARKSIFLLLHTPHWIATLRSYSPVDGLTYTISCPSAMLTSSSALVHTRSEPKSAKFTSLIVHRTTPELSP